MDNSIIKFIRVHSKFAVIAFVLAFLGPLSIFGIILAIADLGFDKHNIYKHTLAKLAIPIGIIVLTISFKYSESISNKETTAVSITPESSASTISQNPDANQPDNEPVELTQEDKEAFINSCNELNYKAVAREPSKYLGMNFSFTCIVSDARETGILSGNQEYYITYAFDMDKASQAVNEGWADNILDAKYSAMDTDICVWLLDTRNKDDDDYIKILDNDIITVYGTFTGMAETKNMLTWEGGEQLALDIKYVELLAE